MTEAALIIAILAILYARNVAGRCNDLEDRLGEVRRSALGRESELEEMEKTVTFLHKVSERLASGVPVDSMMVREKRLFAKVTIADLQAQFDADQPPYVIDVRTEKEWATGHIPGAQHLPVESFEEQLHSVRRDGSAIYLICAMGGRSDSAAAMLGERGYLAVYSVQGGMNAWRGEVVSD
jgi:rhodanese-related sulfurtransferase